MGCLLITYFYGAVDLRIIGEVIQISPGGKAIFKAEMTQGIHDTALVENNRQVRRIFDIIGSTISPNVAISVKIEDPQSIVGDFLHIPSSRN